ncbi:MAG: hypothetical protein CMF31_06775 [Kordiimonas sp.]|nr:hypothetical protein [Kordiimonas sp.]|tara:strand:+ start:3122 stop:4408 length:1287 start_codon:yes stop_codon:yes gene_type:complete
MDELIFIGLCVIMLLMISAFFSGSETALTASSRANLRKMSNDGNIKATLVEKLTSDPESLIGSILLGNNLVNIMASALATSLFIQLFGEAGVFYATAAMTTMVLIFAEVLPKTYAITNPERTSLKVAAPIRICVILFSPIVSTVQAIVRRTLRLFGIDITAQQNVLSSYEEIRGTIDLHAEEGGIIKEHRYMLGSILDLDDIKLEDVMVHRKAVEMINFDNDIHMIIEQICNSPYTRLPIWQEDQDNIIGILHAKDVLRAVHAEDGVFNKLQITDILSEPWFVPEVTSLKEQLNAFLERKAHFALVVDEYGAFMGVITLEDILEEIVGDITDEYDAHNTEIQIQTDGNIKVEGITPIRDLNRQFDWSLSDEDATTIAGYIISKAQTIPLPGQKFRYNDFTFEVLKRRRNQVISILITPPARTEKEPKN